MRQMNLYIIFIRIIEVMDIKKLMGAVLVFDSEDCVISILRVVISGKCSVAKTPLNFSSFKREFLKASVVIWYLELVCQ